MKKEHHIIPDQTKKGLIGVLLTMVEKSSSNEGTHSVSTEKKSGRITTFVFMRNLIAFLQRFRIFLVFAVLQILALSWYVTYLSFPRNQFLTTNNNIAIQILEWEHDLTKHFNLSKNNTELQWENIYWRKRQPKFMYQLSRKKIKVNDTIYEQQYTYIPAEVININNANLGMEKIKAIPAKKIRDRKPQNEVPQIGVRRIQVKAPAENPDVTFAWKVPKIEPSDVKQIDPYALSVLAGILDGHANSRLNRSLVRDLRLADSVDASYGMTGRGPQLFGISASPAKGKTIAEIEKKIRLILNEIRQSGVTEAELNRVKSQLLSSQIYKRDSIFAQAMEIGMSEMNGISWRYLDEILFNIQAVTSADIQRVVEKYFIDDALTVATLEPQPIKEKNAAAQRAPAGMRH